MAAVVLGMAQMAAEAVASREQMRLTQQLREEEMKYRQYEMEWREKDYRSVASNPHPPSCSLARSLTLPSFRPPRSQST